MSCHFGAPVDINLFRHDDVYGDLPLGIDAAYENEARDETVNFSQFTFTRLSETEIGLENYRIKYVFDHTMNAGGNGVVQRYRVWPDQVQAVIENNIPIPRYLAVKLSLSGGALRDEMDVIRDFRRVGLACGLRARPLHVRNNISASSHITSAREFDPRAPSAGVFRTWCSKLNERDPTKKPPPLLLYGDVKLHMATTRMVQEKRPGTTQRVRVQEGDLQKTLVHSLDKGGGRIVILDIAVDAEDDLITLADFIRRYYALFTFIVCIKARPGIHRFTSEVKSRFAVITWDATRLDLFARVPSVKNEEVFPYCVGVVMENCGGSIEQMASLGRRVSFGWINSLVSSLITDSLEIYDKTGRIQADLKLANVLYTKRRGAGFFLIGDLGGFEKKDKPLYTTTAVLPTYRRRDVTTACAAHLAFQLGLMVLLLILQGHGDFVQWLRTHHESLVVANDWGGLDINNMWATVRGRRDEFSSHFGLAYPSEITRQRDGWDVKANGEYLGLEHHVERVQSELLRAVPKERYAEFADEERRKLELARRLLFCENAMEMGELAALLNSELPALENVLQDGSKDDELEEGEIR